MKKNFVRLLILVVFAGFASCDDEDTVAMADVDAFIVTANRLNGGETETVYGLALHALGNKDFTGVTVTTADQQTISLQSTGVGYEYYWEMDEDDFDVQLPADGTYSFACDFTSGEVYSSTDALSDDVLAPASVTSCTYSATNNRIDLEWEALEDADYFVILLKDGDDIVFLSQALAGDEIDYYISESTTQWLNGNTPENGKTYTLVLNAYMFEASAVKQMDIQCKSIATATVVWGQE